MKNGKKLYNERGITFFHETERYVNNLNIYNRSKNGTNLWDDMIIFRQYIRGIFKFQIHSMFAFDWIFKWKEECNNKSSN